MPDAPNPTNDANTHRRTSPGRAPRPASDDWLRAYRWQTEIAFPPLVPLPRGTEGAEPQALRMWIGETPTPHVFAMAVDIEHPQISQTVWGYGVAPEEIVYPGPTLVATRNEAATVTFVNALPSPGTRRRRPTGAGGGARVLPPGTREGEFPFVQPPSDLTAGGMGADAAGRYSVGHAVVHLHGGRMPWIHDGVPHRRPGVETVLRPGESWQHHYHNQQPGGGLLWYHDHTMDATARNVYAGLAGGYVLRAPGEGTSDLPQPVDENHYEVPLILQDRNFTDPDTTGGKSYLLYGHADSLDALHDADRNRDAIRTAARGNPPAPEFKGRALLVNGKVWPYWRVEPRPYRLRILNGCNSRFFVLRLSKSETGEMAPQDPNAERRSDATADFAPKGGLSMFQIGSDGGIFPQAVELTGIAPPVDGKLPERVQPNTRDFLVLAPGERADVVVDFGAHAGQVIYLTNHCNGSTPLGNGDDEVGLYASKDPNGLRSHLLRIEVGPDATADTSGKPLPDYSETEYDEVHGRVPRVLNTALRQMVSSNPPPAPVDTPVGHGDGDEAKRYYVIQEFADIPIGVEDAKYRLPGRHGWSAITFNSVLASAQDPGLLWGGPPPVSPASSPRRYGAPLMGGPAADPTSVAGTPYDDHSAARHKETWYLFNLSPDVHPIHLHLVNFAVLQRRQIVDVGAADFTADDVTASYGDLRVDPNETGWKDTVRMNPGECLVLHVEFDGNGMPAEASLEDRAAPAHFVWHCHLIEHEDMGMMRPLHIV